MKIHLGNFEKFAGGLSDTPYFAMAVVLQFFGEVLEVDEKGPTYINGAFHGIPYFTSIPVLQDCSESSECFVSSNPTCSATRKQQTAGSPIKRGKK